MAQKKPTTGLQRARRIEDHEIEKIDREHFPRWKQRSGGVATAMFVVVCGVTIACSELELDCPVALQQQLVALGVAPEQSIALVAQGDLMMTITYEEFENDNDGEIDYDEWDRPTFVKNYRPSYGKPDATRSFRGPQFARHEGLQAGASAARLRKAKQAMRADLFQEV